MKFLRNIQSNVDQQAWYQVVFLVSSNKHKWYSLVLFIIDFRPFRAVDWWTPFHASLDSTRPYQVAWPNGA